jgi:hypothetical protein
VLGILVPSTCESGNDLLIQLPQSEKLLQFTSILLTVINCKQLLEKHSDIYLYH